MHLSAETGVVKDALEEMEQVYRPRHICEEDKLSVAAPIVLEL